MRDSQNPFVYLGALCSRGGIGFMGYELGDPHRGLDGVKNSGTCSRQLTSQKLLDLAKSSTADPCSIMKLSIAQVLTLPHSPWTEVFTDHSTSFLQYVSIR